MNYFKDVAKDRPVLLLIIGIVLATLVYSVTLILAIQPSETQLYTRYTDFGQAHYYRGYWQYLYTFLTFGLIIAVSHIALIVKLFANQRREAAIGLGWLTLLFFLIIWSYTHSVLAIPH